MEEQVLLRFPFGADGGVKIAGRFGSAWVALYARRDRFAEARAIDGLPQTGVVCMIDESDGSMRGMKVVRTGDGLCGIEGADIKRGDWTAVLAFCANETGMAKGGIASLTGKIMSMSEYFCAQRDLVNEASRVGSDEANAASRAFGEFSLILDALGLRVAADGEKGLGNIKDSGMGAFSEELPSWALQERPDVTKVQGPQGAVREMLKVTGVSRRRLSMQMNRSSGFVDAILQRETGGMKVETLLRVASALGFDLRLEGHSRTFEIESE